MLCIERLNGCPYDCSDLLNFAIQSLKMRCRELQDSLKRLGKKNPAKLRGFEKVVKN